MALKEFTGELDEAPRLKPFDGELDDVARQPLPRDVTPSNAGAGRGPVGGMSLEQAQQVTAPRRGGTRAEARPFVGGDERIPALPQPTGSVLIDKPLPPDLRNPPVSDAELEYNSVSPEARQRLQTLESYNDLTRGPEARSFTPAQNIAQDVREFTSNPVARGAAAGFSQLGQIGVGAVRGTAEAVGANDVADFARGASNAATTVGGGVMQGLSGNDKLVANVTSSIINSLPAVALGTVGGPALRTLFAQSAAADYAETGNAAHAGIVGLAEALGERFGFPEQIRLLKGVLRTMPAGDAAKLLGSMMAKEIPGEQLTTLVEFLNDKIGPGARNPNATLADYLAQAGETLELTVAQTAVMGGGPAAISTARDQIAKANAATARSAQTVPERAAADAGFLRPTQQRKQILDTIDDYAAEHGMPSKLSGAIKAEAETVPLAELPGFIERAKQALQKRGLIRTPPQPAPAAAPAAAPVVPRETTPEAIDAADILGDDAGLSEPSPPTAIDAAAHQAATSPLNDLPEPTEGQKKNGNYTKGHARIAGMDISIENPDGSTRRGADPDGTPWESQTVGHYGYIRGTEGADKDHLDVGIKPGTPEDYAGPVFVIDQIDPKTGRFDEHKSRIGYDTPEEAEAAYRANYPADWQGFAGIHTLPMGAFKAWAKSGKLRKPLGDITNAADTARNDRPAASDSGRSDRGASLRDQQPGDVADDAAAVDAQGVGSVAPAGLQPGAAGNDNALTAEAAPNPKPSKPGRLTSIDDPRLQTDEGQAQLESARANIGWDQVGGRMIRSGTSEAGDGGMGGAVVGRTPWIGSDLWRNRKAAGAEISEADAHAAINNALAGKPMTERQKRFVRYALDQRDAAEEADRKASYEAEGSRLLDGDIEERRLRFGYKAGAEEQAERAAIMAEAELEQADNATVTASDLDTLDNVTTGADAMRALGFTEQEIADEVAREATDRTPQAGAAENPAAGPGEAQAADTARAQAPGYRAEGLTDPFLLDKQELNRQLDAIVSADEAPDLLRAFTVLRKRYMEATGKPSIPPAGSRYLPMYPDGLEAPTADSLQSAEARTKTAERAEATEQARLTREANKAREQAELGDRTRQEASADNFALGQTRTEVEAAMAGNGDLFNAPAETKAKPARDADTQSTITLRKRLGALELLKKCLET